MGSVAFNGSMGLIASMTWFLDVDRIIRDSCEDSIGLFSPESINGKVMPFQSLFYCSAFTEISFEVCICFA
jgi:hypothetical protein